MGIFDLLVSRIELPQSAYEKAKARYEDLGEWLSRNESICREHDPHVFSQGSFRLGTAVYPIDKEQYDLDLVCKLRDSISKQSHTQKQLKELVGHEIEKYRSARGINAPKIERHRCWCLEYADELSFHMDIVPCIPADIINKSHVAEAMVRLGEKRDLAKTVSDLTVSITDNRHPGYELHVQDWLISNPEGYAIWFDSRMNQGLHGVIEKAQVDRIPTYGRRTPLQRSIQLLKRHRDLMFREDKEVKPISIIITTLAARAYQGEEDIKSALKTILTDMGKYLGDVAPRVPNPVDPDEDFADKWAMPQYRHLNLERNFRNWLRQAQIDFDVLRSSTNAYILAEEASSKFSVRVDASCFAEQLGAKLTTPVPPKVHVIDKPPKPWGCMD